MEAWWPVYGEPSVMAGVLLGLMWGWFSTARRRRNFKRAGLEPNSQWLWFLASVISMGSYFTLVLALSLMALNDVLPPLAMWFLMGTAALAFCTALLFARFEAPQQALVAPAVQQPTAEELRKSA